MDKLRLLLNSVCLFLILAVTPLIYAEAIYVSPSENIQNVIDQAGAGDTVILLIGNIRIKNLKIE